MTPDAILAFQLEIHAARERLKAAIDAARNPAIELLHASGHLHNALMDLEIARDIAREKESRHA